MALYYVLQWALEEEEKEEETVLPMKKNLNQVFKISKDEKIKWLQNIFQMSHKYNNFLKMK